MGLLVGEPERVDVLVEDGDRPKLNDGVGEVVGLDVKEDVDVDDGLTPCVKLGVGV